MAHLPPGNTNHVEGRGLSSIIKVSFALQKNKSC